MLSALENLCGPSKPLKAELLPHTVADLIAAARAVLVKLDQLPPIKRGEGQ